MHKFIFVEDHQGFNCDVIKFETNCNLSRDEITKIANKDHGGRISVPWHIFVKNMEEAGYEIKNPIWIATNRDYFYDKESNLPIIRGGTGSY